MDFKYSIKKLYLNKPFITNNGSKKSINQLFVELKWGNFLGYGSSLILEDDNIFDFNNIQLEYLFNNYTPLELESNIDKLMKNTEIPVCMRISIEMALKDIKGKFYNCSLAELWDIKLNNLPPSSVSIGCLDEDELIKEVTTYLNWPILKFKIRSEKDISKVNLVRKIYQGRIWIDANGSLTLESLKNLLPILDELQVELLEQPLPKSNYKFLSGISQFRKDFKIKFVADEDCTSLDDIVNLKSYFDVINIKLTKCGGLTYSKSMLQQAKNYGIEVMLSCKTESTVSIAAISNLAPLADYLDLDGFLDIQNDPFEGIKLNNGNLILNSNTGIGVTPKLEIFTEVNVK